MKEKIISSEILFFPDQMGMRLQWVDENGWFGEIDIVKNMQNGTLEINTETMGKEFAKMVLETIIDQCILSG